MTHPERDKREISEMDKEFYLLARAHISDFRQKWGKVFGDKKVLEIGPEHDVWPGADTFGLGDDCLIKGDITCAAGIKDNTYDFVICTDVIEHVVLPEAAIQEIRRIARHDALCIFSAPWNFRLHNPLPDCWRISVHGWRVLLRNFDILEIDALETSDRWLHPIHYNILARVNKYKQVDARSIIFEAVK